MHRCVLCLGTKALYINRDNSGFAYYESGNVAVCVGSLINGYQVKNFFCTDDPRKALIGTIDEHLTGFALDFTGDDTKYEKGSQFRSRKLVMTKVGAIYTMRTAPLRRVEMESKRQDAGTCEKPIEFNMNDQLKFKFVDRKQVFVYFRAPSEGYNMRSTVEKSLENKDLHRKWSAE